MPKTFVHLKKQDLFMVRLIFVGMQMAVINQNYVLAGPVIIIAESLLKLIPRQFLCWRSCPGCSKLTTSLVNISLKFQTLISKLIQYFYVEKYENLIFSTKNISVFGYEVVKHLT